MNNRPNSEIEENIAAAAKSVIRELSAAGSGHSAGCLGFADVMAVLYFYVMRLDPENLIGKIETFS